ncbi:MAG: hypothetical protein AAB373_03410 [Patescibacteria group bacterium]
MENNTAITRGSEGRARYLRMSEAFSQTAEHPAVRFFRRKAAKSVKQVLGYSISGGTDKALTVTTNYSDKSKSTEVPGPEVVTFKTDFGL